MAPTETITKREQLVTALYDAAELEHTLCCQYLFAAFSLKARKEEWPGDAVAWECVREWKSRLLLLARQEMVHLGVVCNLLSVVGGAPHLERPNFPMPAPLFMPDQRFDLLPFNEEALDRFILVERPRDSDSDGAPQPTVPLPRPALKVRQDRHTGAVSICAVEPGTRFEGEELLPDDELIRIDNRELTAARQCEFLKEAKPGTVVPIEARRKGCQQPLHTKVALDAGFSRPLLGYDSVADLYEKIDVGLGLLAGTKPNQLLVNRGEGQITNESFNYPTSQVVHDMFFPKIKDLKSARGAIQFVQKQGEGTLKEGGHHALLLQTRKELIQMQATHGPAFTPARPVRSNPQAREDLSREGAAFIEQHEARDVALLLNYAYETMLMMLVRLYADAGRDSSKQFIVLRDTALRSIMTMVIRPLGEVLTELPASEDGKWMAGASFEIDSRIPLIHNTKAAWAIFQERLTNLAERSKKMCGRTGVLERMNYVHQNLDCLARDLGVRLKEK
ncbi:ferritin-like domain-containing protein [Pyxidicoccus trucidator]|uniref:ferritin-like domain-containing protein n=1 Tax=Pyxidicoccus trucidator TaxID=2709662 RepID=UPI0013DC2C46|nr:ferritin-like domain-containing protein [Pyxidicoccus trucidator]